MDPNKGYGKGRGAAQDQQAQQAQQNQQAPVVQQNQQAQAGQQNQQAPVRPRPPLTKEQQLALQWVGAAFGLLFEKPTVTIAGRPQVDPLAGQDLRLEFIAGSYSGNAGQPIAEPPVVRLTAGGRPVVNARINFYVSDGQQQGQPATATTNQAGTAQIPPWTLGAAGRHSITAEYFQLQQQRTIRVN